VTCNSFSRTLAAPTLRPCALAAAACALIGRARPRPEAKAADGFFHAVKWTVVPMGLSCAGNLDGNGIVNGTDLGLLLAGWGEVRPELDVNDDGALEGADLRLILGAWGTCAE